LAKLTAQCFKGLEIFEFCGRALFCTEKGK
jgi:hypothetical protein